MSNVRMPVLLIALSFPACGSASPVPPAGADSERPASLAELAGSTWRLVAWSPDEPAAAQPQITLAFGDGNVSGSSGCNLYEAKIAETAPGEVAISGLTSTDRPCFGPMAETDSRFTGALASVDRLAHAGGELVLSGTTAEGAPVELAFERTGQN